MTPDDLFNWMHVVKVLSCFIVDLSWVEHLGASWFNYLFTLMDYKRPRIFILPKTGPKYRILCADLEMHAIEHGDHHQHFVPGLGRSASLEGWWGDLNTMIRSWALLTLIFIQEEILHRNSWFQNTPPSDHGMTVCIWSTHENQERFSVWWMTVKTK